MQRAIYFKAHLLKLPTYLRGLCLLLVVHGSLQQAKSEFDHGAPMMERHIVYRWYTIAISKRNMHSSLAFLDGTGSWVDDRLNLSAKRIFTPSARTKKTRHRDRRTPRKLRLEPFNFEAMICHMMRMYQSNHTPTKGYLGYMCCLERGDWRDRYKGPMRKLEKRLCKHSGWST